MKFLIDGSGRRVLDRWLQWHDGVLGQLITPLTAYNLAAQVFAIDNGAFSGFDESSFVRVLARDYEYRHRCLFVCVPDKVGSHKETLHLWQKHNHLADGWRKAFVAQDGFEGWPEGVSAVFVGGSTQFKDSKEAENIVTTAKAKGLHVHIGRVNQKARFWKFHDLGADTCDGSGVSRFSEKLPMIRDARPTGVNLK